jgi:hypothetical protein
VQVLVVGVPKRSPTPAYPSCGGAGGVELLWERRSASDITVTTPARVQLVGRTRGDQVVVFDGERSLKGVLLDVSITDARNLTLFGRVQTAVTV